MKDLKKSFGMFVGDEKQETCPEESSILDRVKEMLPKEPILAKKTLVDQSNFYLIAKKYSSVLIPKNADPILRELVELGAAYLITDVMKKYNI